MTDYSPPLADIGFVLENLADIEDLSRLNGFQHADPEMVTGVLAEAARFFSEVIAPTNRTGDLQGSQLHDGEVTTPDGFKEAYRAFVEAGWAGVSMPEEWGGGGFPVTVGMALQEMFKSANLALSLCPMLTHGAIDAVMAHGSPEQQATYLEKLVTAEWAGTMCLTEPHAGSDVGALSSRAEPNDDGSYRITGQKIFITWGDQDLTDNIVHLVLARTPGAPEGTRGISLFIVPKFIVGADGSLGDRNSYEIVSLEHKLGIHGSPTCVVQFENATGWLVGDEHKGMRAMFTMMNAARINVGGEGLSGGERALQKALAYANERPQGTATGETGMSLIVQHPDVRRMLITMKALVEASRALFYVTGHSVDLSHHAESEEDRAFHAERVAVLTPIVKAWITDRGMEVTSLGIQVHGGMGYIEETGAAQFFRDMRIAPIYEGTNGIQAIDLVMRKLPLSEGAAIASLLDDMESTAGRLTDADLSKGLATAVATARSTTSWLQSRLAEGAYDDALAGATPYLELLGTAVGGWMMGESLLAAERLLAAGEGDTHFLEAKKATSRFYLTQILPRVAGVESAVTAGAAPLMTAPL